MLDAMVDFNVTGAANMLDAMVDFNGMEVEYRQGESANVGDKCPFSRSTRQAHAWWAGYVETHGIDEWRRRRGFGRMEQRARD